MDVNELRQKRAKIWEDQMQPLLAKAESEKRDLTAEEDAQYRTMSDDMAKLKRQIEREEDSQRIAAELAEFQRSHGDKDDDDQHAQRPGAPTEEQRMMALRSWLTVGTKLEVRGADQIKAAKLCGISLDAKEIGFRLERNARKVLKEFRALSAVTGNLGAYTIPEGFIPNLEVAMLAEGGVRLVADVMRTTTGNELPWPTASDLANEGEILAENTSIGASVDPAFGVVTLNAYKYSSKPIMVPYELLEDTFFDLPGQLGTWTAERIARIQNTHFTTGDGNGKPNGILTASTAGPTTASATAIISDELLDLVHSVNPVYRGPGAGFMFHDSVLLALRKLKESTTNAYIWAPGLQAGAPDTLLSYPYTINQKMPSAIEANAKIALFGQLSKYKIRDVNEIRMIRLNERYADLDQVAFLAFMRSDGDLLDAGSHPVKHLLMHA
jgi:HK97 family phage major capsid protein